MCIIIKRGRRYLLQVKLADELQAPFHFAGGGPNPSSLKLADSGQIPESNNPMTTSLSIVDLGAFAVKPMKSHDRVVCSFFNRLGKTETTASIPDIASQNVATWTGNFA